LGRVLGGWRTGNRLTLADTERAGGPRDAYASQIEQGYKTNVSEEMYRRQARAMRMADETLADLWLRARVKSALEWFGVEDADREAVWETTVKALRSRGYHVETDFAEQLARMMLDPNRPAKRPRRRVDRDMTETPVNE
jgi:hypothetical protein